MKPEMFAQRGQALILIALAAVGLFAFAALAIDGSAVFSDRRHSQNASDTAALAAALARVRANTDWKQLAVDRAKANGYDPADGVTEVKVYSCLEWKTSPDNPVYGEDCKALPATANPDEYVYVRIKSIVNLFFARIIGWQRITNYTDAVVHASIPVLTPWFDGSGVVSTMMGCPPVGYPHDPFTVSGHSSSTVVYSGILVNSDCEFPDAYEQGGSSSVTTDKGVCVAGDADYTNTSPAPDEDCAPIDPEKYVLPSEPTCSKEGSITEISPKVYVASEGWYDDPFPNASPAGVLTLEKGTYCLRAGINLQSTWQITTDLDGNGQHDSASEGVFFYVPGGDVTFNGSSDINIYAISAPYSGFNSAYLNYFMYVPPSNQAVIKITGSDGSSFTGTVLAPTSHVTLTGGSTASGGVDDGEVTIDAQIIGYSVAIAGNGTLHIVYDQSKNGVTTTKPTIAQTE